MYMDWRELTSLEQLDQLIESSYQNPIAIFKHSTRCLISATAKKRLERQWGFDGDEVTPYFLDLLKYREVSNAIEDRLGVRHQSPQLLVIKGGKVIYDASHLSISVKHLGATV